MRLVAFMLLGLALGGPAFAADPQPEAAPPVVAAVVVKPAVRTTIAQTIEGLGTVGSDPNAVLSVNAPFAAIVGQLFARAGDTVGKGQKLVALETTPTQSAAYAQAQAAVTYARGELTRQRRLLRQQLATHAQVAQARNALADAQAKLQALQSEGAGKARTVVTASVAGTITAVSAQVGQHLAEGTNILTLAPQSALVVRLGVEPERADAVRPGMKVHLRDALDPGDTRHGTVESVSAAIDPKTELRDVLVAIQKPQGAIDPPLSVGTYMRGTITLAQAQVVAVPQAAILLDSKGEHLFVVRHGIAHRVEVTTGPENRRLVGVTGIKPGARVVVQGNYELTDGMHVRAVNQ